MVNSKRWKIAQNSEKEYWDKFTKETLLKEEAERHEKKAGILEKEWEKFIDLDKNTKILQIGCGPEDVINSISTGKKYAVDPLANFYKEKFNLDYQGINFVQARGEEVPFKDNFFDLIILANVLDHVEIPQKVLLEIKRVLKDNGIFHFENLFYQKNFIKVAKIWGGIKEFFTKQVFNIHHPYMFTLKDLKKIISQDFSIIQEEIGREIEAYKNMEELKRMKKKDKKITVKIPAIFGLYGTINYMSICRKKEA